MPNLRSNEIVIAIDHRKNGAVFFFPIHRALQSAFRPHRTTGQPKAAINQFSVVYGERVHLDVKNKTGRITHQMADPENKGLLERIRSAVVEIPILAQMGDPHEDEIHRNLSDEQVRTWLYWMSRLVHQERHATVVQGDVPKPNDVLKNGPVPKTILDVRGKIKGETHYRAEEEPVSGKKSAAT